MTKQLFENHLTRAIIEAGDIDEQIKYIKKTFKQAGYRKVRKSKLHNKHNN